jgi:hypothetical protein
MNLSNPIILIVFLSVIGVAFLLTVSILIYKKFQRIKVQNTIEKNKKQIIERLSQFTGENLNTDISGN